MPLGCDRRGAGTERRLLGHALSRAERAAGSADAAAYRGLPFVVTVAAAAPPDLDAGSVRDVGGGRAFIPIRVPVGGEIGVGCAERDFRHHGPTRAVRAPRSTGPIADNREPLVARIAAAPPPDLAAAPRRHVARSKGVVSRDVPLCCRGWISIRQRRRF